MSWKNKIKYYNEIPELYLIWEENNNLHQIIDELISIIQNDDFDKILTVENKGIIFASPISSVLNKPLFVIQKKWKLNDYSNKLETKIINWRNEEETLFLNLKNIKKNGKFIYIDDIIHTQSTLKACIGLIDQTENKIVGIYCISNISQQKEINGIPIFSLI